MTKTTTASPAAVWALLDDSTTWPSWTAIDSHEPIREPAGDGLGEERRFRTGRRAIVERIVERVPERRLTYILLSGLALRDYRAEIDVEPTGEGTRIRWHTTFASKVPGMGPLYRRTLEKITRQFVDGLAAKASGGAA